MTRSKSVKLSDFCGEVSGKILPSVNRLRPSLSRARASSGRKSANASNFCFGLSRGGLHRGRDARRAHEPADIGAWGNIVSPRRASIS